MSERETVMLKVSAGSDARKVGSSIAHCMAEGKEVHIRTVGAGATNQAIKATAIANSWAALRGERWALIPGFADVPGKDGKTISAITLQVIPAR